MTVLRSLLAASLFLLSLPAVAAPLIIGGTIVTPDGPKPNSWLVVDKGRITQITATKPAIPGAKILQTGDLVFPGFVDLHNHPLWAVFPRFDLKTVWKNRAATPAITPRFRTRGGR